MKEGMEFEPKFHSLLTSPFLQSMNQISQIFISHAHADHVGYLLRLMKQSTYANVCMTEITKTLAEYSSMTGCLSEITYRMRKRGWQQKSVDPDHSG